MWGLAGKENIWDLLDVGIGEPLMHGCFDVHITGEFPNFLMSHLMQLFEIPSRLEIFIKVCRRRNSFVPMVIIGFFNGVVW